MSLCVYLVDENNRRVKDPDYNPNRDYQCMGIKPTEIELNIPNIYQSTFDFRRLNNMSCSKIIQVLKRFLLDLENRAKKDEGKKIDFWSPAPSNILKFLNKIMDYSATYPKYKWRVI